MSELKKWQIMAIKSPPIIACDGSACFELKKKPRAEIAKEAKAFHVARKKNTAR